MTLKLFSNLYYSWNEVLELTGYSKMGVNGKINKGTFPAPILFKNNRRGFDKKKVDMWVARNRKYKRKSDYIKK